jgi:WD40 repeat protein
VAFSPDGTTIAAGYYYLVGRAGGVVLWDVAARQRLTDDPLTVKEGVVTAVAFSPDGTTIAAGCIGGVVLWDVAARQRLTDAPLTVEGGVTAVAFSPAGETIAAGYRSGDGGGVVLFDIDLKSWQSIAGRIANRNFTRDEWRQFFPDEPYRATFPDLPVPPAVSPNHASSPAAPSK